MKLQVVCRADAPPVQRQTYPSALCVVRIEVHDRDDDVAAVGIRLAISDDLLVVGVDEFERMIELQGRMRATRLVQARHQLAHRSRLTHVPMPNLVLLRIEVILAAALARTMLA